RVHLRRRRDDRGLDAGLRKRLVEIGRPVRNAVLLRDLLRRFRAAASEAHDLDAVDVLQSIEMLSPECALADDDDLHLILLAISRVTRNARPRGPCGMRGSNPDRAQPAGGEAPSGDRT